MSKTIIISTVPMALLALLLCSCSTAPKPSFYHVKHGKLLVSSPVVDKEMRNCSAILQQQPQKGVRLGAPSILAASIPVIETTDVIKGITKGSAVLKAVVVAKTLKRAQDNMLSCMENKGWKPVK